MTFITEKLAAPARAALALQAPLAASLFFILLWSGGLGGIVLATGGHFSYPLDDAYIHLALSERLAHGHYGINAGEIAAPSSSILWPFLLVAGAGRSWHAYMPLALNFVFGATASWLIGRLVLDWPWPAADRKTGQKSGWQPALIACLLVLAVNLPALALTGMEHTLQLLLALACAYGLLALDREEELPAWCLWAAILGPAVRYESFAITLALGLALVARKRREDAFKLVATSLVLPSLLAVFLLLHGLPPLPASVLVKTGSFANSHGLLSYLVWNLEKIPDLAMTKPLSRPVLALAAICAGGAAFAGSAKRRWAFLAVFAALAGHLTFGTFGWFYRYEPYIIAFGLAATLGLGAGIAVRFWWAAGLLLLVCALPYVTALRETPGAARNVYEQQYQMRRFVQDYYRKDFTVSDLGWVSFNLDPGIKVLDLWGLGSYEAASQVDKNADWLDTITRRENAGLAMIFPEMFHGIPDSWTKVGELYLAGPVVVTPQNHVVFYATADGDPGEIEAELKEFALTLPPGVRLEIGPLFPAKPGP